MTRKLILAAALAASILSGGVAFAQPGPQGPQAIGRDGAPPPPPPPGPRRAFEKADRNGDGVVSRQEYIDAASRRFDKLDRNHDGRLTVEEMGPRGGKHGGRHGMRRNRGDMPPPPPPPAYDDQ